MDISKIIFPTLVATLFNLLIVSGAAQDHPKTSPQGTQSAQTDSNETTAPGARIAFSSRDRETIRVYYKNLSAKLGPGTGARRVPPELQLSLERDGLLSPYLLRRFTPFPPVLDRRLPHLPTNYLRGSINADILIVDARTRRIVDIVHNFLWS
ncbi:MAG TPA: hypothetical protein VJX16_12780 [Terriglobales bacterium]|nr:hypothetical protein [Terriglobales bacterium]